MTSNMRKFVFLLLLVTCWNPSWTSQNNLTMPEVPIELSITSEDDSERELSSQLEEVDSRSSGWSSWSEWSACSRSCDGGASHQLRTCKTGPCRGEHIRYQICNMQALAYFAILATVNASAIAPNAKIIEGPSSKTTLTGPDGSVITSDAAGGKVLIEDQEGEASKESSVAATAPQVKVYASPVTYAAPVVVASAPTVLTKSAQDAEAESNEGATARSSQSAPIISTLSAPIVAIQSSPIITPHIAPLLPSVAQNSLETIIAGPSGSVANAKTAAGPAVVSGPILYTQGIHGFYI